MKRLVIFLMFVACSLNFAYSQIESKPEELAMLVVRHELKSVKNVTDEQFDKLADIEVAIDKEFPYLTGNFPSAKVKTTRLEAVLAMREKLYPKVLTPEQMEQYKIVLKKLKEIVSQPQKTKKK